MLARYTSAVTTGTLMTFVLLFVMQLLIRLQPGAGTEPRPKFPIDWIKIEPVETLVATLDEKLTKKKLTEVDPTPDRPRTNGDLDPLLINTVDPTPPTTSRLAPLGVFTDGPLVALVRVSPVYPARAQSQGIEGYVIVEFDVAADGLVSNIVVLESTNSIFDKAAIRAAERFKFKPRVVDGLPMNSYGIRNMFRFTLDDK